MKIFIYLWELKSEWSSGGHFSILKTLKTPIILA